MKVKHNSSKLRLDLIKTARTLNHCIKSFKPNVRSELSLAQYQTLMALKQKSLTVGELALQFKITQPSVSKTVAALIEKSFVIKILESSDRRRAQIKITPLGLNMIARMEAQSRVSEQNSLSHLNVDQMQNLQRALQVIQGVLK